MEQCGMHEDRAVCHPRLHRHPQRGQSRPWGEGY